MIKGRYIAILGLLLGLLIGEIAHSKTYKVRVRLETIKKSVFYVKGSNLVFQGKISPFQRVAIPPNVFDNTAKIEHSVQMRKSLPFDTKVGLGVMPAAPLYENNVHKSSVWRVTYKGQTQTIYSPLLSVKGGYMRVNQNQVPPNVFFWPKPSGNLDLIAVLDLEDYMLGVLPSEMPASWPIEALKAQAVASRTYAVKKIQSRLDNPFQLDSTTNDQVYKFYDNSLPKKIFKKLKKVLAETKNMVIKNSKGKVVHTYYHSDCGGQTEVPGAVWQNLANSTSVKDPYCPSNKYSKWEHKVTLKDMQKKLRRYGKVEKIKLASHTPSGRVDKLLMVNSWGEEHKITSQQFREMLGYTKLKSTMFEYDIKGDEVHFHGAGHGHGVGLCQHGTKQWAKRGQSFKKILSHYFPDHSLKLL